MKICLCGATNEDSAILCRACGVILQRPDPSIEKTPGQITKEAWVAEGCPQSHCHTPKWRTQAWENIAAAARAPLIEEVKDNERLIGVLSMDLQNCQDQNERLRSQLEIARKALELASTQRPLPHPQGVSMKPLEAK